jgi:hypothetical protein
LAVAGFALEFVVVYDDAASGEDGFDDALDGLAFVGGIVNVHVVGGG